MLHLLLAACVVLPQDSGEKLKKFEQEIGKKESKDPDSSKREVRRAPGEWEWDDDDDDDDFIDAIFESFVMFFVEVIALPFRHAFSDQRLRFDDYPYADGSRKYFMEIGPTEKAHAFEVDLQVGRIEHDLWSIGLDGTFRLPSGCDFNLNVTHFQEKVDGGKDRLTVQQYGLNFGPKGNDRSYHVSIGGGLAIFNGEESSDYGAMLQVDFIHFPARPFSLKYHAGFMIFSDATVTDLSLDIGVHAGRVAFTGGIRSLISSDGEDLTGPTLGVSIFF